MLSLLLLAAAIGQPAPQAAPTAAPPPAAQGSRFGSLFIDWRPTAQEALAREQARLNDRAAADAAAPVRQARALGDQVGEMVALGDCDGGQRLAREAGDQALLRAVEEHCRRQTGVLATSRGPRPRR